MKKFFQDFKKFITRGNIVDMSVGVVVGGAFSAIVTALTSKIITPLINWILHLCGVDNFGTVYTFLTQPQVVDGIPDLSTCIYIDWGAFISAILNFLIIAFVLFLILKMFMKAKGMWNKAIKDSPTRAERKELKAQGVDMRDYKEVLKATAELRESKKPAPEPPKPTQEQLLASILEELKKQNEPKVIEIVEETEVAEAEEEKPKKKSKKKEA